MLPELHRFFGIGFGSWKRPFIFTVRLITMHQDGGGAAGGGGAALEGKDAGERNSSDDAAEERDTHARDDELGAMMKVEGFDII